MSLDFADWAAQLRQLDEAITALVPAAVRIGVPTPAGQEWFELLEHKLRPQLETEPFLVVAIVGGTNIGKSLLFNHLAGEVASAREPPGGRHQASGLLDPVGSQRWRHVGPAV